MCDETVKVKQWLVGLRSNPMPVFAPMCTKLTVPAVMN